MVDDTNRAMDNRENNGLVKTIKKVIEISRKEVIYDEQIELDDPEPARE